MTKSQNRNVNRAALALIAIAFAGATGAAKPAAATPNYDGLWSVVIVVGIVWLLHSPDALRGEPLGDRRAHVAGHFYQLR